MRNAMQLKAMVKKISQEKNVSAQIVLQNYMIERLLERISVSNYKDKLILKGGFLIASIVGINSRSTMDIDITIKGYPLTRDTICEMFSIICSININDDISFEIKNINEIRENDEYNGFRISVVANYNPLVVPIKIDVTTGDVITPKEIEFKYDLMINNKSISLLSYNLETVLAEKLETIISRADQNTRTRDFYDVYILLKFKRKEINNKKLQEALQATSMKRGSSKLLLEFDSILEVIKNSDIMNKQWEKYQNDFTYAQNITFEEICHEIYKLLQSLK